MSLHSFIKESVEARLPPPPSPTQAAATSTPEPSRRYVQWKEDDVGLLLTDLEQPGHYGKWKENKSGFSKRVAEQVFKNVMYHEAIKFKVRWLESRFKLWNQQLTSPEVEQDAAAINNIREKMFKEFPYYDRCKPIFLNQHAMTLSVDSPAVQPPSAIAPATTITTTNTNIESDNNNNTMMKPEPVAHMTNEPSPTLNTPPQRLRNPFTEMNNTKRISNSPPFAAIKKKKVQATSSSSSSSNSNRSLIPATNDHYDNNSNCIYRITADGITDERKVQIMELELELKKMDHQERMQEMKLEQLRLEIELQKLKKETYHHPN